MTNTARVLYEFFSGFGIPAYVQDTIPDDAQMPYITYELIEPEPLSYAMFHANVWYRDTSYTAVSAKCDEIKAAIGRGTSIPTGNGFVALYRDKTTPFAQAMSDPNPETKRMYLSMLIHANTD